jgi:hypothetical protein
MNQVVTQPQAAEMFVGAKKLPAVNAGFFDLQSFELMQRVAKGFAASTLVPKDYQGNSAAAIGNCMIALNLARRIGGDPLMVMQNLVVVHGRPSWSSQFLIASVNTCGRFTALRYEFFGTQGLDDWGCRAWATEKSTGEILRGADITIALAKREGWIGRNGSKWQSMPQQMLMYRAGAWWTKAYAPELSMGLMTADEVEDVIDLVPEPYAAPNGVAEKPRPKPISDRLDEFASEGEPVSDPSASASADDGAPAASPPADPPGETPASPVHTNPGDAGAPELPESVRDAYARGSAAQKDGMPREVPKMFNYVKRKAEADAFLKGWDEAKAKADIEQFGTV